MNSFNIRRNDNYESSSYSLRFNRDKQLKLVAVSIILVMTFSIIPMLSSASEIANLPTVEDILIVNIDNDNAIETTSDIIIDMLKQVDTNIGQDKISSIDLATADGLYFDINNLGTIYHVFTRQKSVLRVKLIQSNLDTFSEDITRFRSKVLIIVGHGIETGLIQTSDSRYSMDWSILALATEVVDAKLRVFASCYSSNAQEYGSDIIGFNGEIDAELGGYGVSLLLMQMMSDVPRNVYDQIVNSAGNRMDNIFKGEQQSVPLGLGLFAPIVYGLPSAARTYLSNRINSWVEVSIFFPFLYYHVQADVSINSFRLRLHLAFDLFGGVIVPLMSASGWLNNLLDVGVQWALVIALGAGIMVLNIPSPVPWQIAAGLGLVAASILGAIAFAEIRMSQHVWDGDGASALMLQLFIASLAAIILGCIGTALSRIRNATKFASEAAASTPPAITGLAKAAVCIAAIVFFALSWYYALYR